MIKPNITSSYLDRIKVYAKDRIGLLFCVWGFSDVWKGTKGNAKDGMISN